jgi:hypothetical protein
MGTDFDVQRSILRACAVLMGYGISHPFNIDRDRTTHPPIEGIMVNTDSSKPEVFMWWNPLKIDEQAFKMLVHLRLILEYGDDGVNEWVSITSRSPQLFGQVWKSTAEPDILTTIRHLTVQAVYDHTTITSK